MIVCSPHCGMSPGSGSGGEVYERELLTRLSERMDVHALLARHQRVDVGFRGVVERLPVGRGLRWPIAPFVFGPAILRCWRQHQFNLLRAHSTRFTGLACLWARRRGVPVPLVVHHHHVDASWLAHVVERPVLRGADRVITDSDFAADQLVALGVERARITVAGCAASAWARPWPRASRPARTVLLAVGPMIRRKRPFFLIQALARLPESFALVWLGDGPLRRSAISLAKDLGVERRFHAPGFVDETIKQGWYRDATLFVHAALVEGQPLAVLDALASGLPVVASRCAALREVVDAGRTGALAEDAWFAETVQEIAAAPRLREQWGAEAARVAHERFEWRRVVERVEAVYRELVHERGARAA